MRFAHIATTVHNRSCPSAQNVNCVPLQKKKSGAYCRGLRKNLKTIFVEFTILLKLPGEVNSNKPRHDPATIQVPFSRPGREILRNLFALPPSVPHNTSRVSCWAAQIKELWALPITSVFSKRHRKQPIQINLGSKSPLVSGRGWLVSKAGMVKENN